MLQLLVPGIAARRVLAIIAVLALSIVGLTVPAQADVVSNNVTVGGNDTTTVGVPTAVTFSLAGTTGGTDPVGCNVTPGNRATATPKAPPGVTVSPSSATFAGCFGEPGGGGGGQVTFEFSSSTAGDFPVTISVSGGKNGSLYTVDGAAFTLHVKPANTDKTPPVLALPGNQTVEATSSSGAVATWTATAYDDGDATSTPVDCTPSSGSSFGIGSTTVTCTSRDSKGNTATGDFKVIVRDTTGPVISLGSQTAEATGPSGATVTYEASASDAIDGPVPVMCAPVSGSTFELGETTVSCTATDSHGNRSVESATVKVTDHTAPALTLTDLSVEAASAAGAEVEYTATAVDLVSGTVAVECDVESGSTFPLGRTTVSCSAADGAGNVASGSFTVTVADNTAPELTLTDMEVEATEAAGAEVKYSATAHDAVSGDLKPDCSPTSDTFFGIGTTVVHCSVTDEAGNTTTGTFTVTVRDTTPPVLTLPDIVVEASGPDGAVAVPTGSALDAVDGAVDVTCTYEADQVFPLGESAVSCSARDTRGNTATGEVTIHVVDTTAPVIGQAPLTAEATGPGGAEVSYSPTATDAVTTEPKVACSPVSGSQFKLGTHTVNCTATDAAGNVGTVSFLVTVKDTTPPQFTAGDVTAEATSRAGAAVPFSTAAHDLVDGDVTANCVPAPDSQFALGSTQVTCDVRDSRGNFTTVVFTVHVDDTTPPALTLPSSGIVTEATGADGAAVTWETSADDLVSGDVPVICDHKSGSRFDLGRTEVTCTATDEAGHTATGSFTVTVRDTTPPAITVTSKVAEATGPDGAKVTYEASARDIVDGPVDVTCSPPSGTTFGLGDTPVTCTAVDRAGNRAEASGTVKVQDTTAPDLTLTDASGEATGRDGAMVEYLASAHDLVDGDRPIDCAPPSGSTFPLGDTTVNCQASDTRGHTATGTLIVTVTDHTPPVITLPQDLTIEATGRSGASFDFDATATDLVDGVRPVTCSRDSGATFPVGDTTVRCSASDTRGNKAQASFTVTVTDTTAPALALPSAVTAEATGPHGAKVDFSATAEDLVDGAVDVTCNPSAGSVFGLGDTPVTCSATDRHGNTATGNFTVTVRDTTGPAITLLPSTAEATGPNGARVAYEAAATDLVDGPVAVHCEPAPGSTFPLGTTPIACTATDTAGNTTTAETTVTVQDTTAPTVSVPTHISATAASKEGAVVSYKATATDLVDHSPALTCDHPSGSTFAPGTTTVSCTARDSSGNVSAPATFTVTVAYAWSGLLQPISLDGRAAFKAGSTIPAKFTLTGESATAVGVTAKLYFAKVDSTSSTDEIAAVGTSAADSGNTFRNDSGSKQYIFNLSTKGWSEGTYQLRVDFGDGVHHVTTVSIRK